MDTSSTVTADSQPFLLERVFEAFRNQGVVWCLLRGAPWDAATPGDIDLLVNPRDLARIEAILLALGFIRLLRWGSTVHPHYLNYEPRSRRWLWLDIATDVAFGAGYRLTTGAASECLARRRLEGTRAFLAPDDQFWALILHCVLDKHAVSEAHRKTLVSLAPWALGDGPLRWLVQQCAPPGPEPAAIVAAVRRDDWESVLAAGPAWTRAWPVRRSDHAEAGGLATLVRSPRLLLQRMSRPGLSIAFLGPDGAGKSTLAAELRKSCPLPSRVIYMGLYSTWLSRAARLRFPPFVTAGRLAVLWARCLLARYHQTRGRLVIFDRYAFDALLPPPRPLSRRDRVARWVDFHACPAPDLSVFLDAPGDLMYQRKGARKHTPEQLAAARQGYHAIAGRIPRLKIVDATRPLDDVLSTVTEQVWAAYRERCA
jgi:thymidylate kinase